MFETIVVGVDGSEASDKAIRIACDLAQKYGAELHMVHSPQPETAVYATAAVAGFPAVAEMPTQDELDKAGAGAPASKKRSPTKTPRKEAGDGKGKNAGAEDEDLILA